MPSVQLDLFTTLEDNRNHHATLNIHCFFHYANHHNGNWNFLFITTRYQNSCYCNNIPSLSKVQNIKLNWYIPFKSFLLICIIALYPKLGTMISKSQNYKNWNQADIPWDSASRYLQILSITSLPFTLFCWNFSTHFCSIFPAIEASADKGFILMLVSCLHMVHPLGLSGCGSYLIFSSTSMNFWRLILRVASCIDRNRASTTVDSTQWHISWPMIFRTNHGPGAWIVRARVICSLPQPGSSLWLRVSTSRMWDRVRLFSGSENLRQDAAVTRSHGCL